MRIFCHCISLDSYVLSFSWSIWRERDAFYRGISGNKGKPQGHFWIPILMMMMMMMNREVIDNHLLILLLLSVPFFYFHTYWYIQTDISCIHLWVNDGGDGEVILCPSSHQAVPDSDSSVSPQRQSSQTQQESFCFLLQPPGIYIYIYTI